MKLNLPSETGEVVNELATHAFGAQRELTLPIMQALVHDVNVANGWFESDRPFADDIALLHSEVSEMFEAYRDWGFEDVTTAQCGKRYHRAHLCKPQGFSSEAADVLIRLLDTAHRKGYEFVWESLAEVTPHEKFDPTATPGQHIALLHLIIAYITVGAGLNSVLAYLVAWCRHLEIDLEVEVLTKLTYNRTRGYRHGGKRI